MRSGELSLAIEISPGFGRDVARGRSVKIGAWIDGAMPTRGETAQSYVQGMHQLWLAAEGVTAARQSCGEPLHHRDSLSVQSRRQEQAGDFAGRNPAVAHADSCMLTALSVVREKELGSIVNLYVTPTARIPAWQAASLRHACDGELPAAYASGCDLVRRAAQGQSSGA
jgi:ribosome-dependent ATPase